MTPPNPATREADAVIVRFAGDSGDGMQLAGTRFTETSALAGNDIATLPDFPAEIRAPAGSLGGVSGFQIQFSSHRVFTPGDRPDVLVAMNPAALARNVEELPDNATIVLDDQAFTRKNLARAGFTDDPREDGTLDRFTVHSAPITKSTLQALDEVEELTSRQKERSKNFFALGLTFWMFDRSLDPTRAWIEQKFGLGTAVGRANALALQKGYDYGVTAELAAGTTLVRPAPIAPGRYRSITGNTATALGFVTAASLAGRPLVYAGYPITPASDILHELSKHKAHGVRTIQAEDEIAAACMAIGASYAGSLGMTASSGPGIALKGEAIGLAAAVELPLVIIDVQRAGPSTGLPTKAEQSDLFLAMHGRNGESPLVVLAPASASDCFDMAIEAWRIATRFMVPVFFLSDAYLANAAEPWKVPVVANLEPIPIAEPSDPETFEPFARDGETLARPWAYPGLAGFEHRIGGLEKAENTGHVSYDPANHQHMSELRREKLERVAAYLPELEVDGTSDDALLVISWGSTWGAVHSGVAEARRRGASVAHAHFRYLSPLPRNTHEVLAAFDKHLAIELNFGQLTSLLRSKTLIDIPCYGKVQGQPLKVSEVLEQILTASESA